MMEWTPDSKDLKLRLREAIRRNSSDCRTIRVRKHAHVYTSGQHDEILYLIESGKVKLLLPTPEGKQCLLGIRGAGEIFGCMCLSGEPRRLETAVAMEDLVLKAISARSFISCLRRADLMECFIRYLAVRVAEQHELVAVLTTKDSEHRLAEILLHLCRASGTPDRRATVIEHRISHSELSEMVGTTRPRIGTFLKKFQILGLIGLTPDRLLLVHTERLRNYLMSGESEAECVSFRKAEAGNTLSAIA